jgi:hypothetical protein
VRLKPESRVALGVPCGNFYIIAVLRGRERVEHIAVSGSIDGAVAQLKESGVAAEIRAAWPLKLAEKLSTPPIDDVDGYLLECKDCIWQLMRSLCEELPKILGSKTDKG